MVDIADRRATPGSQEETAVGKTAQDHLEHARTHADDAEAVLALLILEIDKGNDLNALVLLSKIRELTEDLGTSLLRAAERRYAASRVGQAERRSWNAALDKAAELVEAAAAEHEEGGKTCRCADRIKKHKHRGNNAQPSR